VCEERAKAGLAVQRDRWQAGGMTRADLHRLVDELPEASLDPVAHVLERAKDPVLAMLDAAPWDDEPYTEEERAEDADALTEEPAIPWEQARRELLAGD
jgi:hypothetical protein